MLRMEPFECQVCKGEHQTVACTSVDITARTERLQEEREDIARDEPVIEYLRRVS